MSMSSYLEKIADNFKGEVEVGFMEDAKYDDGLSIAQVAFWNEYGTTKTNGQPGSPPRPFFRNAIATAKGSLVSKLSKKLSANREADALEVMGELMVADIQTSILDGNYAPNSPVTVEGSKPDKNGNQFIKGKGFDKPLVGKFPEMYKSVTYAKVTE
jgi:hypothetical protein